MATGAEQRLQRTALLLGVENIAVLRASHVMIFGLGGVGSYAAEALGRMGVGKLTIVDGDRFEESNLNRQLCALTSTVGLSKAAVTARRILNINPDAVVVPVEAFYLPKSPVPIGEDVNHVVDAVDTVAAKIHIAQTCAARGIPLISCMGMGNRLDPTQIAIGDLYDTSNCPLCRVMRKELRKRGINKLRCVYSKESACACTEGPTVKNGRRKTPGSVAYVPSVAGLFMAYDVVQTLCNRTESGESC